MAKQASAFLQFLKSFYHNDSMISRFHSYLSYFVITASLIGITRTADAQLTAPASSNSTIAVPNLSAPGPDKTSAQISPEAMIFDGAVDPHEYRIGPGDVLQYRSWTSNDAQQLMISADELLVIPRIGEFSTKGKTLGQVKDEVRAHVMTLFKKSKGIVDSSQNLFTLSLTQPRRIYVTVLGEVTTPGVYTYTGGTRAVVAVNVAERPTQHTAVFGDEAFQREQEKRKREQDRLHPYFGDGNEKTSSERNIIVTHSDGSTDRIDIPRFNATHDSRFCPFLREGDVIYVPFKKTTTGQLGVYGAVNRPQDFEYIEGDSLWGMILASEGPASTADLTKVELTRMSASGDSYSTQTINCLAIKTGVAPDVRLESGDRIFVRDNPDMRELSRVIVKGEVLHPGVYPILRTNTKLSDVIKQAGGFTSYAFLAGGTITRPKLDIDNKDITTEDEAKLVGRLSNLDVEDTANFRALTEVREGYVAVDMQRLFEKNDASADVTLRDGDVISVPPTPNTVYVWGYVGSVGYIPYRSGATAFDYIAAAGGYAEGAVKAKTRVIKTRTRRWAKPEETMVEPGDEIFVPKDKMYPDDYSLRVTQTEVSIYATI
ncbi:MAG: SLBB domain-containing protein, partial [Candidatus Kapaibacterium sp.]